MFMIMILMMIFVIIATDAINLKENLLQKYGLNLVELQKFINSSNDDQENHD